MRKLIALTLGVALAGAATVAYAARDAAGTFTFAGVAGGYPYQPGVINRSALNANMAEIAAALTDSASRTGNGGFSSPVRGPDGTASLPAFSFTGDTNSGIYRIGADNIGISLGGTKKVDLSSGAASFVDPASFLGSTTTSGIARFPGGISGSTTFNDPVTFASSVTVTGASTFNDPATFTDAASFASSVTVPTPSASTDAASKGYVDGIVGLTTATATGGSNWNLTTNAIRKRSGVVTVQLVAATPAGTGLFASVATVPDGYRPAADTEGACVITGVIPAGASDQHTIQGLCSVAAAGTVSVTRTSELVTDSGGKDVTRFAATASASVSTSTTVRLTLTYVQ